ncbi:MAG TPA: UbiA-like polyprenyltransferase [Vicinamibacteria bacterium]
MTSLLERAGAYGRMIRFSHSVFALPFALTSAALAAQGGAATGGHVFWIVVAMVAARSAAMGFNRLVDQAIDAKSPRTASRELPRGIVSRGEAWLFVALSVAVFVLAAAMLNPLCLALTPVALAIVLGYSYTKRFTAASHLVLGLALAVAPVGAWLAIRGRFDLVPVVLGLAVLLWVAGFDTLYACQDVEFDRLEGLRSLPAAVGVPRALRLARLMHAGTVLLLLSLFGLAPLHPVYLAGVAAVAVILAWEHSLVGPHDLSRVMQAFNLNGWVSLGYFAVTATASWLRQ